MTTFDRALAIIRKAKTVPDVVSHTVEDDFLTVTFATEPKQSNIELERAGYWIIVTSWSPNGYQWVIVQLSKETK